MSGYEVGRVLVKDFGVIVGPSTIYSKLYTLEKHGLIHCIQGRAGKIYSLTEQGHKTTYNMEEIIEDICDYTKIILSDKRSQRSRKIEKIMAPKVS